MNSSILNWAFFLDYKTDKCALNFKFSPWFIQEHQLPFKELTILEEDIIQIIHRYDYRKLDYFVNVKIDYVFDTLMRFNFTKGKYPLRTLAVCHINESGLSCVNFEESQLLKVKDLLFERKHFQIEINNRVDMKLTDQVLSSGLNSHLSYMTSRDLNIL